MAVTKPTQDDVAMGVQTRTNGGSAGGSQWYINIGGLKMVWGITNAVGPGGGTAAPVTIDFPSSFFSTIQSCVATPTGGGTSANQYLGVVGNSAATTSGVNLYLTSSPQTANSGTTPISYFVLGT